jgi:hypothetical protein
MPTVKLVLDTSRTSPLPSLPRHSLLYCPSTNQKCNLVRPENLPLLQILEYVYNRLKESCVDLVGSKVRFLVYNVFEITPLLKPDF